MLSYIIRFLSCRMTYSTLIVPYPSCLILILPLSSYLRLPKFDFKEIVRIIIYRRRDQKVIKMTHQNFNKLITPSIATQLWHGG